MSSRLTKTAAIVAIVFGALTIISGGRALFGGVDMGAVVPFVLWFNFLAGFAYVAAGLGLWQRLPWAAPLSIAIVSATSLVFIAFLVHASRGLPWEGRTMGAIIFRVLVWIWIAIVAHSNRNAVKGLDG